MKINFSKMHSNQTKNYIGILGDPAKLELYSEEFYDVLKWDENGHSYHLIGGSERDIGKTDYLRMYSKFRDRLGSQTFRSILNLKHKGLDFSSRIGLFPSALSHLISGPTFIFAPYPINSSSNYLRTKAAILIRIVSILSSKTVFPTAYAPHGGKAADRTKSKIQDLVNNVNELFYESRQKKWFELHYLEAGSGEKNLDITYIHGVLLYQVAGMLRKKPSEIKNNEFFNNSKNERIIVPNSIYGGGIVEAKDVEKILNPKTPIKFVPQTLIVGNISENNISKTYEIIEKINEFNESNATSIFHNTL